MSRRQIAHLLPCLVVVVAVLLIHRPQLAAKETPCKNIKIHNEIQAKTE